VRAIILIPGIFGCSMKDCQGRIVWPPGETSRTISTEELVNILLDPRTAPVGLIDSAPCAGPIYGTLSAKLRNMQNAQLIEASYDWRVDIRKAANQISKVFDTIDARSEIIIVAHSMGGLVARWLLESNEFKGAAWYSRVKLLICVAVPHLGAPVALFRLFGLDAFNPIILPAWACKALDSQPHDYPSGYQLLPPSEVQCVSRHGVPTSDVLSAFAARLDPTGVDAIRSLHDVLDAFRKPSTVSYRLAYGIGTSRTVSGVLMNDDATPQEGGGDGDGTVPAWSGKPFLQAARNMFAQEAAFIADHTGILSNAHFLQQVTTWIDEDLVPATPLTS
jgi:phospholipase A1